MKGRSTIAGFWLAHCFANPASLGDPLAELFDLAAAGKLAPIVGGEYPLSDIATAHQDLRARRTVGKLVLDPSH